jgi:endonuclease YncB( thermonuclease family)
MRQRGSLRILLLLALAFAPHSALADFTGRVVKVADGDTITVLVKKIQIRVRLESIQQAFAAITGQNVRW